MEDVKKALREFAQLKSALKRAKKTLISNLLEESKNDPKKLVGQKVEMIGLQCGVISYIDPEGSFFEIEGITDPNDGDPIAFMFENLTEESLIHLNRVLVGRDEIDPEDLSYMIGICNSIKKGNFKMREVTYKGVTYLSWDRPKSKAEAVFSKLLGTGQEPSQFIQIKLAESGYKVVPIDCDDLGWIAGGVEIPGKGTILFTSTPPKLK